ncbi:MAG TPA: hypothetical protein VE422_51070 [Terriglobia bacterium]|nr:hypothetical protein [Terriglobia bacterium]
MGTQSRKQNGTGLVQRIPLPEKEGNNVFPILFVFLLVFATTARSQSRFGFQESETTRRTLEFSSSGGTKVLELDNVQGSIRVTGYSGSNVEMVANQRIRAESDERLRAAKKEVRLDVTDKSSTIEIYVDQPGNGRRDRSDSWRSRSHWNDRGYDVAFDFDIRVPRDTKVRLRTVNDGDIRVQNVSGDFDVESVNGNVEMLEMSGSGRAHTVNGQMKVGFAGNPAQASYFGSLNGDVEVTFQPNLSANLRFKSFNGGVYTDFPTTALPAPAAAAERRNGKFVYRTNGFSNARVGNGGPEIQFDGFNGNVRILRAR